jgi:hypothetical protein
MTWRNFFGSELGKGIFKGQVVVVEQATFDHGEFPCVFELFYT